MENDDFLPNTPPSPILTAKRRPKRKSNRSLNFKEKRAKLAKIKEEHTEINVVEYEQDDFNGFVEEECKFSLELNDKFKEFIGDLTGCSNSPKSALEPAKNHVETLKSTESISECENTENCDKIEDFGFKTASGKKVKMSDDPHLQLDIFKDIPGMDCFKLEPNGKLKEPEEVVKKIDEISTIKFSNGTSKKLPSPNRNLVKIQKSSNGVSGRIDEDVIEDFPDSDEGKPEEVVQFSTASGKKIEVPRTAFKKAHKIFEDIPKLPRKQLFSTTSGEEEQMLEASSNGTNKMLEEITNLPRVGPEILQFSTASGKKIQISDTTSKKAQQIFEKIPHVPRRETDFLQFSTASGSKLQVPETTLKKAQKIFEGIPNLHTKESESPRFSTASGRIVPVLESSLNRANKIFEDIPNLPRKEAEVSNYSTPERNTESSTPRKTLGTFSNHKSNLNQSLNKAKNIFSDMNFDDLKLPDSFTSTPHRFSSTPNVSNVPNTVQNHHNPFKKLFPTTPITIQQTKNNSNELFVLQKPTLGNTNSRLEQLHDRKTLLENELEMISRKIEAIHDQIQAISVVEKPTIEKKIPKFTLTDISNLKFDVEISNRIVLQINPQNAILVHFNPKLCNADISLKLNRFGCVLIPNAQNLIGISEIEPGFPSMKDVDSTLIPPNWIRNHYKWIVWKLASYERHFPQVLTGCFTIENVLNQLRYRYFRELYNSERPSLRKIYENDDVASKRLVLCVSNIFKKENVELELTDGWYAIRTIIDKLLIAQVWAKKIKIGTKLMISNAEILNNPNGCGPLESELCNNVRLKINYNSTRRAERYLKLGYQKFSLPFLVKLDSCQPSGGQIGGIQVLITRIYSTIYKETIGTNFVWRNEKAELKLEESSTNRRVIPVFQCAVIDYPFEKVERMHKLTFWDAQFHNNFNVDQFKEGVTMRFYNIFMKSDLELVCNKKTRFETIKQTIEDHQKFSRKYVELDDYENMVHNSLFFEFDTIGIILKIQINEDSQSFWLTNFEKKIVQVKISEGPETCLILNRIEDGDIVAVCNLKLDAKKHGKFTISHGSYHTIVTKNPKFKFLQDELEKEPWKNVTENQNQLDELLNEVRDEIELLEVEVATPLGEEHQEAQHSSDLNSSRITNTDLVMSMINIEEIIVNNTE